MALSIIEGMTTESSINGFFLDSPIKSGNDELIHIVGIQYVESSFTVKKALKKHKKSLCSLRAL